MWEEGEAAETVSAVQLELQALHRVQRLIAVDSACSMEHTV